MKSKIIFINDLHFGIADTERLYKELLNNFIPFVEQNPVDIIFMGGDYFDHKLSLYEGSSMLALNFFSTLVNICKEKNIKLRTIEGTQSHDRFQPRILKNFADTAETIDFKYFETVGTETVNGINILYVPEEYPMNIDEYYSEYRKNKFDLMLVHGTWDFINFSGAVDNNRNDINTAPVFKYEEWKDTLENGYSICGHIHGRHIYKTKKNEKIIYPGSFTSWSFDQISKRGFLYGEFDTETHKLDYKFINNPDAPIYANLDLKDMTMNLDSSSVDEIKKAIDEQKEKVDFIKVNLDCLSEDKKLIIKEYYKDNKHVQTEFTPKKLLLEATDNKKYEKYDYLLKDNLTIEKAIQRFMKEEYEISMDEDTIKALISE